MKILVTGGAGFLGSHLTKRLLDDGLKVVCLDNFVTGSKSNILEFEGNSNFELIEGDVTTPIEIQVDGIYNLACPASPIHYQRNPVTTTKTSILGALNMLNLAHINNARILQASTSEIYGDPLISPQAEDYWGNVNPIGIRSCYDEGKRLAESLFFDSNREFSTDIRVARIFNTYGPKMLINDGRVVTNFILQAIRNEPITVYGDGTQKRSFCFVSDLIDGLVTLFNKEVQLGPINLGNPTPITMLQLANEIISLCNSKSIVTFDALPQDDPKSREPDITKAREVLGWSPKIDRDTGLKSTIEDVRRQLKNIDLS
jgi:UDP-glucuronate decarboxylase